MNNAVTVSSSDSEQDDYQYLTKGGKIFENSSSGPQFNVDDSDILADTVDLNSSNSSSDDGHKTLKRYRSAKTRSKRKKTGSPNKKRTVKDQNSSDSSPCSTPKKKKRNGQCSADSSDDELNLTPVSVYKPANDNSKKNSNPFLYSYEDDINDVIEVVTPIRDHQVVLPIKLKLRYHATMERLEVDQDAPMSQVYELAAKRFNIPEDRLTIHKSGQVIPRNVTPQSLSLNITHILDCYEMEDSVQSSKSAQEQEEETAEDRIQLKVQSRDRKSTELITIKKTDAMHVLMSQYAILKNLPLDSLKFRFDGDLLNPEDTPNDLDMEGGEVIDASH